MFLGFVHEQERETQENEPARSMNKKSGKPGTPHN